MFEQHAFSQVPTAKSDLQKLKREVLDKEPKAALPGNLPDEWLGLLARDLEMFLQEQGDHCYLTAPLAIIVHILYGKYGHKVSEISFSEEELFNYLQDLRIEISIEMVRRCSGIVPESATFETIFTNRDVYITEAGNCPLYRVKSKTFVFDNLDCSS